MVYEITDLKQLNSTDVDALLVKITEELAAENPTLDLKRGVFHDSVLYYHAVLESAIRENLNRYLSARSLQQIEVDPTLADTTTVNDVLSNWGITRKEGTQAKGEVTIVVSKSTSVTIAAGAIFEANGISFTSDLGYTSTANSSGVATENDRLMVQLADGNWEFTIFVTAVNVGSAGKLTANKAIVPEDAITNYVASFVTADFSDGTNTETNTELITQLQDGLSAKALSNRVNMRALLRSLSQFASVTNQSIVGYGDAEMLRDRHSVFPISYGGRVDWYVRGQSDLQTVTLTKEAALISIDSSGTGTWQFTLVKDDAPGFYEVSRIYLPSSDPEETGTFNISSDTRGLDLTGSGFIPDIATQAEGAFTAYQTGTIQFVDTVTDASSMSAGDKQNYTVEVHNTPSVKELQDYMSSRDVRSYGADILMKAPVPCFVQISCVINKSAGDSDPDVAGIKTTIAHLVNNTGFIGRLDGSRVLDAIHGYIQNDVSVTDLDILGKIITPAGTIMWLHDSSSIVVVDSTDAMVTSKTVQFFTSVDDISVDIETTIPTFT
jgi:hypothetical protein